MKHHWRYEKILELEAASEKAAELKAQGKKIITANGSFDILHAGHLDLLEEARQQGDVLFIGLNSDTSIKEEKGQIRPFISEQERAAMLAALICIDYVAIIDASYDDLPSVFIKAIKPAVHVNGAEYGSPETWVEYPAMQEVGAIGHAVERRPGLATTDLIKKIQSA